MAAESDGVHTALTSLYSAGGGLEKAPEWLLAYFDDAAGVRLAKPHMARQRGVAGGGRAVVVAPDPPGAVRLRR